MTSVPIKKFFGHEVHADYVGEGGATYWASSYWMKETQNEVWVKKFLHNEPQPSPFQEKGTAIRAYLLGRQSEGLTTANHPEYGSFIGYSTPNGFALASRYENQWLVSNEKYFNILKTWWDDWYRLGKPSYVQLEAFLEGNRVRVKLKK